MTEKTKKHVTWVLSILLGIVFVGAAVMKFNFTPYLERDITNFFGTKAEGMGLGIASLARCLIAFELALGLALMQPFWRKRLLLPLYLLTLVLFSVYLFSLDPTAANCGCFGSWLPMGPRTSLVKNIVFSLITIVTLVISPPDPKGTILVPILCMVGATCLTFAITPTSHYVTSSAEGIELSALGTFENEKQSLAKGVTLVCFLNSTCEHCEEAAMDLDDFSTKWQMPIFFALHGKHDEIRDFREMTGAEDIPWKRVELSLFLSATGQAPPRYHLLKDGKSIKYWDGPFDGKAIVEAIKRVAKGKNP